MSKKLTIFSVATCAILGFLVFKSSGKQIQGDELTVANVEALSSYESDATPEINDQERRKCESEGGVYAHFSACEGSGFETVECTVEGELDFMGMKIKGSYKKGSSHNIAWARYNCHPNMVTRTGCCTKTGLYSGENKLA